MGKGTRMTTIDLSTGIERPSDPKGYITKIAVIRAAKPGTQHPPWNFFLARVTVAEARDSRELGSALMALPPPTNDIDITDFLAKLTNRPPDCNPDFP
jgi:hypothetical protein